MFRVNLAGQFYANGLAAEIPSSPRLLGLICGQRWRQIPSALNYLLSQ
jgi:hypothetical protein